MIQTSQLAVIRPVSQGSHHQQLQHEVLWLMLASTAA
jgi:hypothetical protein